MSDSKQVADAIKAELLEQMGEWSNYVKGVDFDRLAEAAIKARQRALVDQVRDAVVAFDKPLRNMTDRAYERDEENP